MDVKLNSDMKEANFPRSVKEVIFGAWSLDPKRQTITDGNEVRELEPLLYKILCYLIINKDEIITRQDLVDDVWCQNFVDDNAINRAMSQLRKVLKSDIQRGLVVKTHYRKGYSFFLEPEIIYYDSETLTSPVHTKAITTPITKSRKIIFLGFMIFILIPIYFIYSNSEALKNEPTLIEKDFKEKTLSWMNGVYTELNISPNNNYVALSFTQKDQSNSALLLKNLNTGQEKRVTERDANLYPVGWSYNSERVIYRLQNKSKCEFWDIDLAENLESNFLFNCDFQPVIASNISKDVYIYSKYGYRNRSELSVLVNKNLATGDEFQISSPNLNSYGDKFLYYIKDKNKVVFERVQFDTSELYLTDAEGGAQVKLYETKNRIWNLNYNNSSDSLLWFDNKENILYEYSFITNEVKENLLVNVEHRYSSTAPISPNEILALIYPFQNSIYELDIATSKALKVSKSKSRFASYYNDKLAYLVLGKDFNELIFNNSDGNEDKIKITSKYNDVIVSPTSEYILGVKDSSIDIIRQNDSSIFRKIQADDTIISVEYLDDGKVGYIVKGESRLGNVSYIYDPVNSKNILLPINNAVWFEQLTSTKFIYLNNLDELAFFDSNAGIKNTDFKLEKAYYKHSLSLDNGKIYHSNGKSIFEIDIVNNLEVTGSKIHEVDGNKFFINDISFSSANNAIAIEMIEMVENELVMLTHGNKSE